VTRVSYGQAGYETQLGASLDHHHYAEANGDRVNGEQFKGLKMDDYST
jgi:hypothetical protein